MYSSTLPSTSVLDGGWMVSTTPRPLYPRERPGTHCTVGWVGPRAGLDGCGKFPPTGIRSPDLPACSESLYRLSYRGRLNFMWMQQIILHVKHPVRRETSELYTQDGHCAERNSSDQVSEGQAMIHTHACRICMSYIILCKGLWPTHIAVLISFQCFLYICI